MKRKIILFFVLAVLLAAVSTAGAAGTASPVQPKIVPGYTLSWWTIDAGGGQNFTGGAYSLSAAVGQPDAANASGSGYSLAGGFWGPGISGSVVKPLTFKILLPFMRR